MTLCKVRRQSNAAGNAGRGLIGSYEVVEGGELIVTHLSYPAGIKLADKPGRYICVKILESLGKNVEEHTVL